MDQNEACANKSAIPDAVVKLANAIATESAPAIEFNVPKGAKVHFLGQPILALVAGANNAVIGAEFRQHQLIRDRYFFPLPQDVWACLYKILGKKPFAGDLARLEDAAASICQDSSSNVGLYSGGAIPYSLLRTSPKGWRMAGKSRRALEIDVQEAKLDLALEQAEKRIRPLRVVARGYVGWLLTCRRFLDEHDALFMQWSDMVQRWGVTKLGICFPVKGMFHTGEDPAADPRWPDFSTAFEEFFIRWRLQGMAAPYLPIPLQPLLAGDMPVSVLPQLTRAAGVFCLPDTFPVPSRDELRNLLEPVLHGDPKPDHLKEWMEFIATNNVAKRPIARFGRLFEFQHYYRILDHRYGEALRGKSNVLKQVLAKVLHTSQKTIVGDLSFIRQRLGKDWLDRGRSSTIGPF